MDPQSMDPMSKSMPTHPAAKGVLVDQYAQIALFDAEENQRQIMANQTLEAQKKRHLKQAAMLKERAQEREWLVKEHVMGASSGGTDGLSNPNVTGFCKIAILSRFVRCPSR